jgi:2-polyprenyl-3-methyl-5-hydroxy-6-metoxy-1,4-benzoquinol methylase
MIKERISQEAWLSRMISSLSDASLRSPHGDLLPGFPSEELQKNTTSISGEQALRQAHSFYNDICDVIEPTGYGLHNEAKVLDFGSCWGRITRFFMRDVALANLYGIDVVSEFVTECRELFGSTNFDQCAAMPPCDHASASMDLVSAYSVFSHLSESAFLAWMSEFHRVLRPGGILAFTTRSEVFLDYCQHLRDSNAGLTGYTAALAQMIPNVNEARKRYRSGEFLFATGQGLSGGGAMNESFYGESFIPESYVLGALSDRFDLLTFKSVGSAYDQALFVLRKKP